MNNPDRTFSSHILSALCIAAVVFTVCGTGCASVSAGGQPETLAHTDGEKAEAFASVLDEEARLQPEMNSLRTQIADLLAKGKVDESKKLNSKLQSLQQQVVEKYKVFVSEYPDEATAHNELGEAYEDFTGDTQAAEKEYKRALALNPRLADAHNNLATILTHTGRIEEGVKHYHKAIENEPDNATYHYNIAQSYFLFRPAITRAFGWDNSTLFRKAAAESRKARDLDPMEFDYALDYAMTFFGAPDFGVKIPRDDAVAAWKYAIKKFPEKSVRKDCRAFLGRLHLRLKEFDEAEQIFAELSREKPGDDLYKQLIKRTREDRKLTQKE
ncbi:tetratricopeptide repeat protein [Candidatus Hydrogenedentota bacterium]